MLKLDFLNVGDGDAILIREDASDFILLADTGRPHVEFTNGSKRRACLNHLMEAGIDHIDLMVLTHLHFDHIGGALAVLRHIPVKRLMAVYLPPEGARWIPAPNSEPSWVSRPPSATAMTKAIVPMPMAALTIETAKLEIVPCRAWLPSI